MDNNNEHLQAWDRVFASRGWGRYPPDELVRFMDRTFGDVADKRVILVLEVGCGPGPNLWYLAAEGFTIAGIDGSQTAVDLARQRLKEEGLHDHAEKADLRQGDFRSLPWCSDNFDVIIDIEAIYANRMSVIRSCINEIHRVLVDGGRFFGKMFGTQTTGYGTGTIVEQNTSENPTGGACGGFGTSHFFTEEELRDVFSAFREFKLDWVRRSDREQSAFVFEWLVSARKQAWPRLPVRARQNRRTA